MTERTPAQNPRERAEDRLPRRLYRDVWLAAITAIVLFSLTSFETDVDRQREGRRIAIEVLCSVQDAVIQAGREQLLGSVTLPGDRRRKDGTISEGPLSKHLGRYGYPPPAARQDNAEKSATMYATRIAEAVAAKAGRQVKEVVTTEDYRLDCDGLLKAGNAH